MSDNGEFYGEIYLAKCKKGKMKWYIGQTILGHETRWQQHVYEAMKGKVGCTALYNAIRKYGAENFDVEVLVVCKTQEELNEYEEELIEELNTLVPNGYNIRSGGSRSPLSEETKKKMSEARTGEGNGMFGRKHSDETKEKIAKCQLGRKHSEEEKVKASNANKTDKTLPMYLVPCKAYPETHKAGGYAVIRCPGKKDKYFTSGKYTMEKKLEMALEYLNS